MLPWHSSTTRHNQHVAPYWADRTANAGSEGFIFFGVYPADAGHRNGTIESEGFPMLLVEQDGVPTLIPNPSHGSVEKGRERTEL